MHELQQTGLETEDDYLKNREVSLRGKLVRDMMKNMMDSAMGHKIQTGEYRMDPKEPAWICPPDY